jgi:dTDP-4-amino-4,6-dideoxygalactose transaminase
MVTTNKEVWADKVKMYGLHGLSKDAWRRYSDKGFVHYQVIFPGYKYNMMDIQASLGLHQMKRVDQYQKRRKEIWEIYNKAFSSLAVTCPTKPEKNTVHAKHLYTLLIDTEKVNKTRDKVQQELHQLNIGTGIHFISLHLHDYYRKTYGYKPDDFPNAQWISERTLSLPLSAKLTNDDVEDVIRTLERVLTNNR